ncbi:MAG TPA: SIS domain-containing protein [Candidatus Saccharimonadia bacterium]
MDRLDKAGSRRRYDKDNVLELIGRQLNQLCAEIAAPKGLEPARIKRVLVAGMGGSALASEFARSAWAGRLSWPVEIVKEYALPAYVDAETLVMCSSFSGSSEETLEALAAARQAGAQVVAVTAGGKLLETARAKELPHVQLPGGIQGRYGVLSGVLAWAVLAETLGAAEGLVAELRAAAEAVAADAAGWAQDVPAEQNRAKQMAESLLGHDVVVYAGPTLGAIAQKWKVDFNENAKNVAWWNVLPEMNHNELSGWGHPEEHACQVVELQSELDHSQVRKRFEIMNQLMSARWTPLAVQVPGDGQVAQMVWAFMLGSYVSAYLALLNQVEISTLPLVDKLKAQL